MTSDTYIAESGIASTTDANSGLAVRRDATPEFDLTERPESTAPGRSTTPASKPPSTPADRRLRSHLIGLIAVALLSVLAYYCISRYVVMTVIVQGRSMAPTLRDGDQLLLNRAIFHARAPRRGEMVVLMDPGHNDYAVKRIIGVPTDSLHFRRGEIFLNGSRLRESYLSPGLKTYTPDYKEKWVELGPDWFFVLGDNRASSEDSRFYGPVHRSQILGLVVQ